MEGVRVKLRTKIWEVSLFVGILFLTACGRAHYRPFCRPAPPGATLTRLRCVMLHVDVPKEGAWWYLSGWQVYDNQSRGSYQSVRQKMSAAYADCNQWIAKCSQQAQKEKQHGKSPQKEKAR
jgi:hypothetical protein